MSTYFSAHSISRVLFSILADEASIIYLLLQSPTVSSDLPPDSGRAILNYRYTWSCNPLGVLPKSIATFAVGSYPTFSPLPRAPNLKGRNSAWGGYFLLHYYALTDIRPLTRTVLYVARTVLPLFAQAAIERVCRFICICY